MLSEEIRFAYEQYNVRCFGFFQYITNTVYEGVYEEVAEEYGNTYDADVLVQALKKRLDETHGLEKAMAEAQAWYDDNIKQDIE